MPTVREVENMVHQLSLSDKLLVFSDLEDELLAENSFIHSELDKARQEIAAGKTATLSEALSALAE